MDVDFERRSGRCVGKAAYPAVFAIQQRRTCMRSARVWIELLAIGRTQDEPCRMEARDHTTLRVRDVPVIARDDLRRYETDRVEHPVPGIVADIATRLQHDGVRRDRIHVS